MAGKHPKPSAPRNPVARSPLLKKGGAHRKSNKDARRQAREKIREEIETQLKDSTDKDAKKNADD